MKNYLNADLHRIMTKKLRIFLVLLLGITDVVLVAVRASSAPNVIAATTEVGRQDFIYVNIIMLVNILISFGDDFHAKSIQAVLGSGVKRHQIIFVKWISLVLTAVMDMTFLTVLQFIPLFVMGRLAGAYVAGSVIFSQTGSVFVIAMASALALIILFQTQKALLGVLAYTYLSMDMTSGIMSMAISNRLVQKFQLWNIGAVNQLETFISKVWMGQFDIRNFFMVVFYFALGFWGAIYLFKKKELDF